MAIKFEFYPDFEDNIYRASYRSRSSLKPLYDKVRQTTDEIYFNAKAAIDKEQSRAESEYEAARQIRFRKTGRSIFLNAKAKAFALKTAANSVKPTMGFDGKEIYGRIAIFRKDSGTLEFGGTDSTAEVGKGSGEYVSHPSYAFLRRAMDQTGG